VVQGSPQPLIAANHLAFCRISYFQMNPDTQFRGGGWVNDWTLPDMPGAIRIEMAPAAPDATRLPVVTVTAPVHTNWFFDDPRYEDQ
jgi:hypothetical protein